MVGRLLDAWMVFLPKFSFMDALNLRLENSFPPSISDGMMWTDIEDKEGTDDDQKIKFKLDRGSNHHRWPDYWVFGATCICRLVEANMKQPVGDFPLAHHQDRSGENRTPRFPGLAGADCSQEESKITLNVLFSHLLLLRAFSLVPQIMSCYRFGQ